MLETPANRRAFLLFGGLTVAGIGLTGCSTVGGTAAAAPTSTGSTDTALEEAAVEEILTRIRTLHADAGSLASGILPSGATLRLPGATARLLNRVVEVHEAQLTALGSPTATAAPTATPSAAPTVSESASGIAELAQAEWEAARSAFTTAAGLSPEFALLLYKIAASCAANADLLQTATKGDPLGALTVEPEAEADAEPDTGSDTGPDTGSDTQPDTGPDAESEAGPGQTATDSPTPLTSGETEALNRLLAGEHAAFYAYPLVIAHINRPRRTVAAALWETHRQQRDQLERLLMAAGEDPVQAGAAYEVAAPATGPKAAALAAEIERRLAGLAVDAVAAAESELVESTAAGLLVLSTRRYAAWSNKPVADPGT